jgi:uncharacterized membrane protein YfcA
MGIASYLLGWASALLVGFSKTGLPGVSIPAILLMTEAFSDDAKFAVGVMLPVLLVGDVFAVAWYRHHARWSLLWRLFPYVALGMVPGGAVLWTAKQNELRPVIGVTVLALLALECLRRRFDLEHLPHRWWFAAMMGALAGFATVIAHAAFPVMSIYLISRGLRKHEFIGTAAWFFLVLNLSKVPVYLFLGGMFSAETVRFDLVVAPVAILGGLLGVLILPHIPQKLFDVLALTLAAVAAVRLIALS